MCYQPAIVIVLAMCVRVDRREVRESRDTRLLFAIDCPSDGPRLFQPYSAIIHRPHARPAHVASASLTSRRSALERSFPIIRAAALMPFAQLVIGPPGCGKSTYCDGMQQFLNALGRTTSIVNLDPANDHTSYKPALDIRDLVSLDEIMESEDLGPNGGVLYALEDIEENWEWMQTELKGLGDDYVIFDCPGQVELFTHHETMPRMFHKIEKLGYRVSPICV